MSYKFFSMDDTDTGRTALVLASDISKALELYKRAYGAYPERVCDRTADGQTIIIEGVLEVDLIGRSAEKEPS